MAWNHKIRLKYLFTKKEDHASVQTSMTSIADEIKKHPFFVGFDVSRFYRIPGGNDFFQPVDFANKLLDEMYNFADSRRIWIE